jgi:hypothetical protein
MERVDAPGVDTRDLCQIENQHLRTARQLADESTSESDPALSANVAGHPKDDRTRSYRLRLDSRTVVVHFPSGISCPTAMERK